MPWVTIHRGGRTWRVNTDFWGSALKLYWKVSLPHLLKSGKISESEKFKISYIDIYAGSKYSSTNFSSPSNFKQFIIDVFNSADLDTAYASLEEAVSKIGETLTSDLKEAFWTNFREGSFKWKSVSKPRLMRRALMGALGHSNQLPEDPAIHYNEDVFKQVIDSFQLKTMVDRAKGNLRIEFASTNVDSIANVRHPDFMGHKSEYAGPDQILMSIMGLNITKNPGVSSTGKKMIVPVDGEFVRYSRTSYRRRVRRKSGKEEWVTINLPYEQKAMAYVGGGNYKLFTYPSGSNPQPNGIPVIFVNNIYTGNVYFQRPFSSEERVVFWSREKGRGEKTVFPENVRNILFEHGLISKE